MQTPKGAFWNGVIEWARAVAIAVIIVLPIRAFVAEPFIVNGASMDPTFGTGQFLIVDRVSYRLGEPSRGDVVIFEYPNDPKTYYIKRILGLPGETVSMKDGRVYVAATNTTSAGKEPRPIREPYLGQVRVSPEDMPAIELGPTEYFVMGDNRDQSSDSRSWGPLERRFLVGRPIMRLTPVNAIGWLPGAAEASYDLSTTTERAE